MTLQTSLTENTGKQIDVAEEACKIAEENLESEYIQLQRKVSFLLSMSFLPSCHGYSLIAA